MPLITCPLCGSDVKIPNRTPHLPLLCRKCHSPFHLDRAGTAILGRPPDVERDVEELKQLVREKVREFPVKKVVGAVGFLLIAGLLLSYLLRGNDLLQPAAESAAQAFAANDLDTLKSMAVSGTTDALARWYEETHPALVQQRGRWNGKPEAVEIGVEAIDPATRQGASAFCVRLAAGNGRDGSFVSNGEFTTNTEGAFDSALVWTLSPSGHWLIDGQKTYAKLHPTASSLGSAQASTTTR